jgi:hypothetical protein
MTSDKPMSKGFISDLLVPYLDGSYKPLHLYANKRGGGTLLAEIT